MVFMLVVTLWAMFENVAEFQSTGAWHLVAMNVAIIALDVWMIIEAVLVLRKLHNTAPM